jgi:hypothetical protein
MVQVFTCVSLVPRYNWYMETASKKPRLYSGHEDRMWEKLCAQGVVSIGEVNVPEMLALKAMCLRGICDFRRFGKNIGYMLLGRNLISGVR